MTPAEFIAKWSRVELSERSASQSHFIDLCHLLGQPTPTEHDPTGDKYTFEKSVSPSGEASRGSKGQWGFCDVWWRNKFAWEYKRKDKHRTLTDAYRQLQQYREALGNPPLLIVSDINRIEIHTNFTYSERRTHTIALDDLASPESLELLRKVFEDPEWFRPTRTTEHITQDVASRFAEIAQGMRRRGHDPHDTAHFLMKCVFCLFAEDAGLLPAEIFKKLLTRYRDDPARLQSRMSELFALMRTGGEFGLDEISYFNGGLFDDAPALKMTGSEIDTIVLTARQDWSSVEPAIFGTLFERSLDPSKRSQIGAHYTSRDDILLIVEPVVMQPLRREWEDVRAAIDTQLERRRKSTTKQTAQKADRAIDACFNDFLHRLGSIRILDPACGSGNFLYVAIQQILDLEKQVITDAAELGIGLFPNVRPTQLLGIELNPYAAELAQVVIWIGYLQWMRDNGFVPPRDPILAPIQSIECRDAIVDDDGRPASWPEADFIIGNPPFLGSKLFRKYGLDDAYLETLYEAYPDIPNASDLCCYWFELARRSIARNDAASHSGTPRVGLLATQGIRGGANRTVLQRIKNTGDIFMAHADREWILDGAAVHVSIVGFDDGTETQRILDRKPVDAIYADLSGDVDLSSAGVLDENTAIAFMGDTKGGSFDIEWTAARRMLTDANPNGRPNLDVVRPWINGSDITKRTRSMWIVDFGCDMSENDAAQYGSPFRHVEEHVRPKRITNRRKAYAERWWIHVEPRPAMRDRLPSNRYVASPTLTKFRLFKFVDGHVLTDHQAIAFARSDDYFFGVLHSSIHELWARRMGTQLREAESGFRYTPTSCFETFALPWPPGTEPPGDPVYERVAEAARDLNKQRERWLNPPEWIEPIAAFVDGRDDFADVADVSGEEARRLIRESAIQARAARDSRLKRRTLTNLYNERPAWLRNAHEALDRAVLAAYAATDPDGDWDEDFAAVWRESGAGQPLSEDHEHADRRLGTDERVLTNLVRLNRERSG